MIDYLYWALLLIGLILVYFALKLYRETQVLTETGIRTTAVVIDLVEVADDDGPMYKPVFEFTDKSNKKVNFKSEVSSRPPAYRLGEKVQIVYDGNDRANVKTVSFWGLYRWTILLLSLACPLLIIGGGYLLYTNG